MEPRLIGGRDSDFFPTSKKEDRRFF